MIIISKLKIIISIFRIVIIKTLDHIQVMEIMLLIITKIKNKLFKQIKKIKIFF